MSKLKNPVHISGGAVKITAAHVSDNNANIVDWPEFLLSISVIGILWNICRSSRGWTGRKLWVNGTPSVLWIFLNAAICQQNFII